jgi:hypothetical protein
MYLAASKMRGFFPIRYAQGQNDNIILITATVKLL